MSQLDTVSSLYRVLDKDVVLAYLRTHPVLTDVLIHTAHRLRDTAYFPDATLLLELVVLPGGERRLCLTVNSQLDRLDALPRMDLFEETWLFPEVSDLMDALHLNLECR